jgi:D-alanyl-lipoteichoic acid acyltransferase DltB (MBOAT superfamily)
MLFGSQAFLLLFLPICLAGYFWLAGHKRTRLGWLTLASFFFYGYWDLRFVPLLAGSIAGNWLLVRAIHPRQTRWLTLACVSLNLGLLAVFKYADFFAGNALWLVGATHDPWQLVLPLGISFFTFEQISYAIDRRNGRAPDYDLLDYAAYVAFFPHLLAGPIIRHDELIFQFADDPRRPGWDERAGRGLVLFTLGLIKKVWFADIFGRDANRLFDAAANGSVLGWQDGWHAALAYTLQLYFDFSAYSDMAIGLGLMFGLTLPQNFDAPYRALNIRDFWRRWHMTLSAFLRDYLYIPLGGNRQTAWRVAVTVMVTMLLCGLWHGAGWTFVAWGALHGVAIVVSRAWARHGVRLPIVAAWLATMLLVVVGWVLFRAANFSVAGGILRGMGGFSGAGVAVSGEDLRMLALGMVFAIAGPSNLEWARMRWLSHSAVAAVTALALLAVTLRVGAGKSVEFIYFQF